LPARDDVDELGIAGAVVGQLVEAHTAGSSARSLTPSSTQAGGSTAADQELLASVQRKLRKRSKRKFYGDGWSAS